VADVGAAAVQDRLSRGFGRIKVYKQMPQLIDALHRHAHHDTEIGGAAA
jgi:hypothetical protein